MYLGEFISKVSDRTGVRESSIKEIYDAMIDEIKEELNHGGEVNLTNFGKFYVTEFASRTITCPTGEKKKLKARNVIKFKTGAGLKDCAPKIKK